MTRTIVSPSLELTWEQHQRRWTNCSRCPIGDLCNKHVLGRGKLPAHALFIGEAPGPSEDSIGYPFVGRSGKILDSLIADCQLCVGIFSYYITNTIACYPSDPESDKGFRAPDPRELEECRERVTHVLEMCKPERLVYVGKVAAELDKIWLAQPAVADLLLPDKRIVIYHPSYLLRRGGKNSLEYKQTLQDLRKFMR